MNINWIWYLGLGYLLGSIPFALVIGKFFYKTDVRNFGSGNLGGTNAGRVLGKKAGISVIACDVLKVVLAVGVVSCFDKEASIWAGFAAAFGPVSYTHLDVYKRQVEIIVMIHGW